jgi:hypothetical protein
VSVWGLEIIASVDVETIADVFVRINEARCPPQLERIIETAQPHRSRWKRPRFNIKPLVSLT